MSRLTPVEASLEELKAAWQRTWQDITQERMWSDDHCAEINGKIRQLLRLNERVRNIVLCEEEPRDLPAEMNFDEGYDHLTEQQRAYMKKMLAPEGSFFMKCNTRKLCGRRQSSSTCKAHLLKQAGTSA